MLVQKIFHPNFYYFSRSERRVTIKDDSTTAISQEISVEQSSSNKEQVKVFRKELAEKSARLEAVMAEKSQLQNRIKVLEDRGFDGKNKNLETISRYVHFVYATFCRTSKMSFSIRNLIAFLFSIVFLSFRE